MFTHRLSFVCSTNIGITLLPSSFPPFLPSSLPPFLPSFLLPHIKGVIVRVPDDKDLKEAQLPDSLRGILSARIDRLTSNQQWVLKVWRVGGVLFVVCCMSFVVCRLLLLLLL